MDLAQLKIYLKKEENEELEFKLCRDKLGDSFWETYSAFANTNGGLIILGIQEENGRVKSIKGVRNPSKIKTDIINTSNSKSKVSVNSIKYVELIEIENKTLIVVSVKKATDVDKPVYINNNIKLSYFRLGEADQLMQYNMVKAMIINSSENLDSNLLPETFTIDDINLDTVTRYRSLIKEDVSVYSSSVQEFLYELGVFKKDREDANKIKLTKGGLLFFGKFNAITDIIPHFQLDYFERINNSENRWEDRVSSGDMEYPELNIFDFYLIVYEKISSGLKDKFVLDKNKNQRLPFKSNLQESFREALVNCLMHSHYDINFPIKIDSYNEYVEFSNPGIMKISVEEFFNGGTSRVVNDTIATLFRRVGISEKAGTGGKRIYDVSEKLNLKKPEVIIKEDGCTKLRIWKKDLLSTLDLPSNELKIMEYMLEKIVASKNQISQDLGISDYYTRIALKNLEEAKHIIKDGKSRATRYYLSINNPRGKTGFLKNIVKMLDNN